MPGSVRENDTDIISFVQDNNVKTVLDIGAGSGTYSKLLKEHVDYIDGVEVWETYIGQFGLESQYDELFLGDVREFNWNRPYDMVIFGDVLEHMSRQDSLRVWAESSYWCDYGVISVPIIHYPQGAEFGNPFEVHVQEHLHPDDLRKDYGPFVLDKEYDVTGTFIRRFK